MSNESRRKLLKSIAAGSGAIVAGKSLPESWSRPVVDSVMLPAHAETSPGQNLTGSYTTQVDVTLGDSNLLDTLIPTAQASIVTPAAPWNICINVTNGLAVIQMTNGDKKGIWTGSSNLDFSKITLLNDGKKKKLKWISGAWDAETNRINGKFNYDGTKYKFSAKSVPDGGTCQLEATVF
jgi:hypothetical protein